MKGWGSVWEGRPFVKRSEDGLGPFGAGATRLGTNTTTNTTIAGSCPSSSVSLSRLRIEKRLLVVGTGFYMGMELQGIWLEDLCWSRHNIPDLRSRIGVPPSMADFGLTKPQVKNLQIPQHMPSTRGIPKRLRRSGILWRGQPKSFNQVPFDAPHAQKPAPTPCSVFFIPNKKDAKQTWIGLVAKRVGQRRRAQSFVKRDLVF